ncbi:hypothetical protein JST97_18410 [bacterium]|nr:hypothetical protein [bacterium]
MKKIAFAIPLILTLSGWAQSKPERDPFVNLEARTTVVQEAPIHTSSAHIQTQAHRSSALPTATRQAPQLNVLGLLTNSKQPRAIVAGNKNTYIVAQGDRLGDYRVARIDRSGITLAYRQLRYHCPIGQ